MIERLRGGCTRVIEWNEKKGSKNKVKRPRIKE